MSVAICGKPTIDGTPCRNGPGCTAKHQPPPTETSPAGPPVVSAGPDPFGTPGSGDSTPPSGTPERGLWDRMREQSRDAVPIAAVGTAAGVAAASAGPVAAAAATAAATAAAKVVLPAWREGRHERGRRRRIRDIVRFGSLERRIRLADGTRDADVLSRLARDRDPAVRSAAAHNESTPQEALELLARDRDPAVRLCVAGNPNTPADALTHLANDPDTDYDYWVRRGVAANPSTPPETLTVLAADPSWEVRESAAGNPSSNLEEISKADCPDVRAAVAENPAASNSVLAALGGDPDPNVREKVLYREDCPPEALDAIARTATGWHSRYQRAVVAKNPNAPKETLEHLAKDDFSNVRMGVAGNPETPLAALLGIFDRQYDEQQDHHEWPKKLDAAMHPNCPPATLTVLAGDPDTEVRRYVARNPGTPPATLTVLAGDPDTEVRWHVAANLNTPADTFTALADDTEPDVRMMADVRVMADVRAISNPDATDVEQEVQATRRRLYR